LKKLAAAAAALLAALTVGVATASADGVTFGVNDNAGLYGNTNFWSELEGENMSLNTIILRWNEQSSDGFDGADGQFLPKAMAAAAAAGVQVELAVSPRHSAELSDQGGPAKFAAWLTKLAQAYPQVTQYVVMNECNISTFVNPQYQNGQNVSAPECGTWLAAGYDALKAVNPSIFVWGLGLSPRGNPVPANGQDTRATDPVDWLGFLGKWYRASGRTKPLMDGLDLHPYAIPQSLPFAQGYKDASSYSVTNLPRAYAAFYNAFNGTAQPTVGPGRLPVQLNEVGIQTAANGHSGYTGSETAANASGGVIPPYDTEAYQADWYSQLVDYTECDADIVNVNIFKLIDETALEGWQSGLYYADGAAKASAAAVRDEIAKDGGKCPTGSATRWQPGATTAGGVPAGSPATSGTGTAGAPAAFGTRIIQGTIVGPFRVLAAGDPTMTIGSTGFGVGGIAALAPMTVNVSAIRELVQTNGVRRPASAAGADKAKPAPKKKAAAKKKPKKKAANQTVLFAKSYKKGQKVALKVGVGKLRDGSYRLVVTLKAKTGGRTATITSKPFAVKAHKIVLG
jgi:hypothetical protein